MEPKKSRLLRLDEVLHRLSVSRSCLYAGIRKGRFPSGMKIGRMTFWLEEDIDALIEALKAGGSLQKSQAA